MMFVSMFPFEHLVELDELAFDTRLLRHHAAGDRTLPSAAPFTSLIL
jgi:hypothetical protein